MRINVAILLVMLIGIFLGTSASVALDGKEKCQKMEEVIRQNSSVSGALACFQPGIIEVNMSERVKDNTELECVCRRESNGVIHIWPITRANITQVNS